MEDWTKPPKELQDDPLQRPKDVAPVEDEFDEPEQEPTPRDRVVERAQQRRAERQSRMGIPQEQEESTEDFMERMHAQQVADGQAQEPAQNAQEPQQREDDGKVAELLQQLIDATRAATEASGATTEAVREMATSMVEAMGEVKAAIENLNLGVE